MKSQRARQARITSKHVLCVLTQSWLMYVWTLESKYLMTVWFAPHYHCLPLNKFADMLPYIVPHPSSCFKWYIHSNTFILKLHIRDKTAKETGVWSFHFTLLLFIYWMKRLILHLEHHAYYIPGVVSYLAWTLTLRVHLSCPVLSCPCRTTSRTGTTPLSSWWTPNRRSPSSSRTRRPPWVWRRCTSPPPLAWTSWSGCEGSTALKASGNSTTLTHGRQSEQTRHRPPPPPPEVLHGTCFSIEF